MKLLLRGWPRRPLSAQDAVSLRLPNNASVRLETLEDVPEPKAASLLAFWHDQRPAGGLPDRRAFDPTEMTEWLGYISVYEYLSDRGDFLNRLEGTYVADLTRENWTGRKASEVDARFGSSFLSELLETRALREPVIDLVQIYQNDYGAAVRLLLPLSREGGDDVDQVFAAFFARNYQPPRLL